MSDETPSEPPKPNLLKRIATLIRSRAREVDADEVSKALPARVMPRDAVVKQRVRYNKLDEDTKE